jgi:hypothetical protein
MVKMGQNFIMCLSIDWYDLLWLEDLTLELCMDMEMEIKDVC